MTYGSLNGSRNRGFPAGNPIANVLVIIVGALAIGASIVLGFFAFVVLSCVILIMAAVIGIRLWWFKRKMGNAEPFASDTSGGSEARPTGGVIEGEYIVVEKDQGKT
jgi:hypothetical protein